jgi:hypothetical protein
VRFPSEWSELPQIVTYGQQLCVKLFTWLRADLYSGDVETLEQFQAELKALLGEHGPATLRYCRLHLQRVEYALEAHRAALTGRPEWWLRRTRRALRQAMLGLRQSLWAERGPTLQANLNRVLWAGQCLDSGELGWNAFQKVCQEEVDWLEMLSRFNGLRGEAQAVYEELLRDVLRLAADSSSLGDLYNFQRYWMDRKWSDACLDRQFLRLLDGWAEQAEEVLQLHARVGLVEEVEETWQRLLVLLGQDPSPHGEALQSMFELCWQLASRRDVPSLEARLQQLAQLWRLYCARETTSSLPATEVLASRHLRDLHGLGQCVLEGILPPEVLLNEIERQRERHRVARQLSRQSAPLQRGIEYAEDALILLEHFAYTREPRHLERAFQGFNRSEYVLTRLLEEAA